jgi:hypothetical protein
VQLSWTVLACPLLLVLVAELLLLLLLPLAGLAALRGPLRLGVRRSCSCC